MPIYEYRCTACDRRLEKLQKISDPPLMDCPECGQPALTKLVSAAGFRLKGGGWYETDFKDKGKRNLAGESGSKPDGKSGDGASQPDKASSNSSSGSKDASGGNKGGSSATSSAA